VKTPPLLCLCASLLAIGLCSSPGHAARDEFILVKIAAINDFHGQLEEGLKQDDRPVGGAPVLAAWMRGVATQDAAACFYVHAGDLIGASGPLSSLLQDEPTISFFNSLGNSHCSSEDPLHPDCNLVGAPGNHEFDEGVEEFLRLQNGGNHADGPFLQDPWKGAAFPHVCANLVWEKTGQFVVPPYVIKNAGSDSVKVAFIGAVLRETADIVNPDGTASLRFLDEAAAINACAQYLKNALRVKSMVVLIHQGGKQPPYAGLTSDSAQPASGRVVEIVKELDDEIDVVCAGHWHSFTNARVRNRNGVPILVTQARAKGRAFADISLMIDPHSKDIDTAFARIVTAWADSGRGLFPDSTAMDLVRAAETKLGPIIRKQVGIAAAAITRHRTETGESALGNLIADAQRFAMKSDCAFMNPGGIRTNIDSGSVTWGDLFRVQPFGNELVAMELSGSELLDVLHQQWRGRKNPCMLQVSGISYTWKAESQDSVALADVRINGKRVKPSRYYSVTVNSYLASGGDGFPAFTTGRNRRNGPGDIQALESYISRNSPVSARIEGRIRLSGL
jgi:5'-nucleotidase